MSDFAIPKLPTSTVHQSRLQLYQPTRRPVWSERLIETSWGSAVVRGKLGQVHADIMESICYLAEDNRVIEATGQIQLLVDPFKVRTCVGGGTLYGHTTLWRMLSELREASVMLNIESLKLKILGGILDRVEMSTAQKKNRFTGSNRNLWRVTLDPAFSSMLSDDVSLYYDPAKLASIDRGISQAIARHVLTHRHQPQGGWVLDNLIQIVGAGTSSIDIRNRRRDVYSTKDKLKEIGVLVEDDRVYVSKSHNLT